MTYSIYGLRLNGEREVRYIGLTSKSLPARLAKHIAFARGWTVRRDFYDWLIENASAVEIFKIAEAATAEDAAAVERETIHLCVKLQQRLFNETHVPRSQVETIA